MTAKVIDGRALARSLRGELRERVRTLEAAGTVPGLAVVLVGDDPASHVYVENKIRACADVGVASVRRSRPAGTSTEELVAEIEELNRDPRIHGVLVQLPLPDHVDMRRVLESIDVAKDVDGFHLYNVGALVVGRSIFSPCTPYGVVRLLEQEGIPIATRNAVVVGASNIVGKPMGLMLLHREATVTICHARTRDLAQYTRLADILVVAAGVPGLIGPDMVRPGAAVIDVGINRLPSGRLVGDVQYDAVRRRAGHITPVPGGVGPMTVTMLLENTIASAERAHVDAAAVALTH